MRAMETESNMHACVTCVVQVLDLGHCMIGERGISDLANCMIDTLSVNPKWPLRWLLLSHNSAGTIGWFVPRPWA